MRENGKRAVWRPLALCRRLGLVGPLLWLAAGAAVLGLFLLARRHPAWMALWVQRVSMPYKRLMSALVDPLPFSAAEALCTAGALAALAWLGRGLWLLAHGCPGGMARRLAVLAAVGLWVYGLVCAFWGSQYYAPTLQEQTGLYAQPVSTEALRATTAYFAARVNETAGAVPRDGDGLFAVDKAEILAGADGVFLALEQQWPCLAGPVRTPKPAVYSWFMSLSGFTGYLFPLLGESTLNVHCPAVLLPATIAHEISHQRGVAPEQEANFCAVLAATTCGDPVYAYSGWLFGYIYLFNALAAADGNSALAVRDSLCPEAMADLEANSAYWAGFEGQVKTVMQQNYGSFIRGYGQELGMASYGACVDLLVAWYGGAA